MRRARAWVIYVSTLGAVAAVVSLWAVSIGLVVEIATAGTVGRLAAAGVALAVGGAYWTVSGWVIRRRARRATDG